MIMTSTDQRKNIIELEHTHAYIHLQTEAQGQKTKRGLKDDYLVSTWDNVYVRNNVLKS